VPLIQSLAENLQDSLRLKVEEEENSCLFLPELPQLNQTFLCGVDRPHPTLHLILVRALAPRAPSPEDVSQSLDITRMLEIEVILLGRLHQLCRSDTVLLTAMRNSERRCIFLFLVLGVGVGEVELEVKVEVKADRNWNWK
jgi:hypothetical protein